MLTRVIASQRVRDFGDGVEEGVVEVDDEDEVEVEEVEAYR